MARRGKFGRLPRVAPSLTNTLIAIAREMQARRDSNIMSAWEKGGVFEGRLVTDAMVLAHWKGRLEGIDPNDPLYDTYKNAYTQIDYSIHESKISTQYQQGKINERDVANFYLSWAKKVPRGSEFWRVLQRDAAQFMRSYKTKQEALAKQRAEDAYQSRMLGMYENDQVLGEYLLEVLNSMAQTGSAALGIAPVAGSLDKFDPGDPEQMIRLLGQIAPAVLPQGEQPWSDDMPLFMKDGKVVTAQDVVKWIRKNDPTWNGVLDVGYVQDALGRMRRSVQAQIKLAKTTGHTSDVTKLQDRLASVTELDRQVTAWPVQRDYMEAANEWRDVRDDPTASVSAKMAAWSKYQSTLLLLADDPRTANDPYMRSVLTAEANMDPGAPTLSEDFSGAGRGTRMGEGENSTNKVNVSVWTDMADAVEKGAAYWTQGTWNKGVFTVEAGGIGIGAATPQEVLTASGEPAVPMYIPSGDGASNIMVLGVGMPVYVTAGGRPDVQVDSSVPVATLYRAVIGGRQVDVWRYVASDRTVRYTTSPLWDTGRVRTLYVRGTVQLDVSGVIPTSNPLEQDWDPSKQKYLLLAPTASQPAQMIMVNPALVLFTSDPDRLAAGPDPTTDFFSASLAAIMGLPDSIAVMETMKKDPAWSTFLDNEARTQAGFYQDPKTGEWISGLAVPTDSDRFYRDATRQNTLVTSSTDPKIMSTAFDALQAEWNRMWNRTNTEPTIGTIPKDVPMTGDPVKDRFAVSLASDILRGISNQFSPLVDFLMPGTNQIKPFSAKSATGPGPATIKSNAVIKLPTVATTPTPTPTTWPTTPGYEALAGITPLPGISTGTVTPVAEPREPPPPRVTTRPVAW